MACDFITTNKWKETPKFNPVCTLVPLCTLIRYHILTVFVVAALPFISGLVIGFALEFVGSSYPLIIILLYWQIQGIEMLAYLLLPMASVIWEWWIMMGPVHLCLLVSNDYFHADLAGTYWFGRFFCLWFIKRYLRCGKNIAPSLYAPPPANQGLW